MARGNLKKSQAAFERAKKCIPGGVNSPVRAFRAVGGTPPFIARGAGSRIVDIDGNSYVDYVTSWGPLILGHAHPKVVEAIARAAAKGTSFGAPTPGETELVEEIKDAFPSVELARLVSSGTEAAMSAVRLARAFTGRDLVIKFDGCYHGHADSLLVKAGSGALTFGTPSSPGVVEALAKETASLRYNDAGMVADYLKKHGDKIAAVIVEPVAGNMGVVAPAKGFLSALRRLTRKHGALLIFDEVITGFRVARGGAQELYGVRADLTVLGKIIGGGLPVGAFGGRRDIMEKLSPLGACYQAGTLSGNPVAVAAGLATLKELRRPAVYRSLESRSKRLAEGLAAAAKRAGISTTTNRVGSMMTLFFHRGPVANYDDAVRSDVRAWARFHGQMLTRGVYLAPSQYEAVFLSTAHSSADISATLAAAEEAFAAL